MVQRTDQTLFMELRNDCNHPIFVSYAPQNHSAATTFLTYSLQKRTAADGEFREYGEAFHFVPNLRRIDAKSAITFRLISFPKEKGEYKVRVGYYEDEEVYKMVSERLLQMTDAERERAKEASKHVLSDAFLVPSIRTQRQPIR